MQKNATSFLRKAESFLPQFKLSSLRHLLGRARSDASGVAPAPWALLPRVTPGLVQIPPALLFICYRFLLFRTIQLRSLYHQPPSDPGEARQSLSQITCI